MSGTETKAKSKGNPLLEWIAAGIGLATFVCMITFLMIEAIGSGKSEPPLLRIEPVELAGSDGRHVLEVKVTNGSGQTAAGVQIEGVLRQGGTDVETSVTTIDYVPGHSNRRGGLIFTRDPRAHQVELRATGYQRP